MRRPVNYAGEHVGVSPMRVCSYVIDIIRPSISRLTPAARHRFRFLLVSIACCLSQATASAEAFPLAFQAPPELDQPLRDKLDALARGHADDMYRRLLLKIDEADRLFELSDAQVRLLRVAAKGAVQDSLEAWLHPILAELSSTASTSDRATMKARLISLNGGQRGVAEPFHAAQQQRFGPQGIVKIEGGFQAPTKKYVSIGQNRANVVGHEVFVRAWKSTLTTDQIERLSKAAVARAYEPGLNRKERLVNEIARQLLLDDEQRNEVAALIAGIQDEPIVRWLDGRSAIPTAAMADMAMPALPVDKLKLILSPVQWEQWKSAEQKEEKEDKQERVPRRGRTFAF